MAVLSIYSPPPTVVEKRPENSSTSAAAAFAEICKDVSPPAANRLPRKLPRSSLRPSVSSLTGKSGQLWDLRLRLRSSLLSGVRCRPPRSRPPMPLPSLLRLISPPLFPLAKATYVNSYRGGPLLYTNPPGVSLNRLELKKQMRYFFCAKTFCVLCKKMFWGKSLA
jgi:hypothetical protein